MQPLTALRRNLSGLLRAWRELCHTVQESASNGFGVFWAGMNGLCLAWVSTYDYEFTSFMISTGSRKSLSSTTAGLCLFTHVPYLLSCLLYPSDYAAQYCPSCPSSPLDNLDFNLCSPFSSGDLLSLFSLESLLQIPVPVS
jgi:hypothetical protein